MKKKKSLEILAKFCLKNQQLVNLKMEFELLQIVILKKGR